MSRDTRPALVLGSGPAGASAAAALLARGRKVLLIDAGETLEPARAARRARMAATEPDGWLDADLSDLRRDHQEAQSDAMRPFGSDFMFRDRGGFFAESEGWPIAVRPSFAQGGLSNGWGSAVLPYRDEDLEAWPFGADALAPHYRAVAELAPMSARPDDLATLFPALPIEDDRALTLTAQAQAMLGRLEKRRDALGRMGVRFGQARQAVAPGCRRCAMCLYGCPYGLIFNAADLTRRLVQDEGLDYRPGFHAEAFEEDADGVRLHTRAVDGGARATFEGSALFVAGGVLPTARLVLNSLGAVDRPVTLRDSQHFFLPMLQSWAPLRNPEREPRNTLTQLFLEILDPAVSPTTVHAQVYTYNDFYAADMRRRFGRLARAVDPLIGAMSRRLIVAQAFLHSDVSPDIQLRLNGAGRLSASVRENAAMAGAVERARGRLARVAMAAGLAPLLPLSRLGAPGSSFHCGGTFPMRTSPTGLECDSLGRPAGMKRTHLVDASGFPSIPATTITLSVMANAHRIGSLAEA